MHLNRLDFSNQTRWAKGDNHSGLEDTSLNTAHWGSANASNLVDILKWESEGLVRGTLKLIDHVQGLPLYQSWLVDLSIMLSPSKLENGTKGILSGLHPTFLRYEEIPFTISSYIALILGCGGIHTGEGH